MKMTYEQLKERLETCKDRTYECTASEDEKYIAENVDSVTSFCEAALALGLVS